MTSPSNTVSGPGGRHYTHPERPGALYMGVTTAISGGVPKNLGNWFKKITATYAVEHRHIWEQLEPAAAVDLISREADRIRDAAADRGTIVHTLVETAGKLDPSTCADFEGFRDAALSGAGPWLAGIEGYVDAGLRFLWDWRPQIDMAETTVYSHRWSYAGTFDLLATVPTLGRLILDWKTSKDVYAETGLQLAAYRFADGALIDGVERPIPDIDGGAAVHLRPDGTYAVVPLACGADEHRTFLHALQVARYTGEGWKAMRRPPIIAVPTERPWWCSPARRQWVIDRIGHLAGHSPAGMASLAASWPVGVPTFKQADHHTDGQLAAIIAAVSAVEATLSIPFYLPDPATVEVSGVLDRLTPQACEALRERLATLPTDIANRVAAAVHRADLPKLRSGRFNAEHAVELEALLRPAEIEAAQRAAALADMLGDLATDAALVVAVVRRASDRRHRDPSRLTDEELERCRLLVAAITSGALVCTWYADGVNLTVPPEAELRLLDGVGGTKSALWAAGKAAAKALGLPAPRSSSDVVGDPLLVARLAADAA